MKKKKFLVTESPIKENHFYFSFVFRINNIWILKKICKTFRRNQFSFYIYSFQSEHSLASRNHLFIFDNTDLECICINFFAFQWKIYWSGCSLVSVPTTKNLFLRQWFSTFLNCWSTYTLYNLSECLIERHYECIHNCEECIQWFWLYYTQSYFGERKRSEKYFHKWSVFLVIWMVLNSKFSLNLHSDYGTNVKIYRIKLWIAWENCWQHVRFVQYFDTLFHWKLLYR